MNSIGSFLGGAAGGVAPDGVLRVSRANWPGFDLGHLRSRVKSDGLIRAVTARQVSDVPGPEGWRIEEQFEGGLRLSRAIRREADRLVIRSTLENRSAKPVILNEVLLLRSDAGEHPIAFGSTREAIRMLEQGNYWGAVTGLVRPAKVTPVGGEPNVAEIPAAAARVSELVTVIFDRAAQQACLAGFTTAARWKGRIELVAEADGRAAEWSVGFDGGDLRVEPAERIELEEAVLAWGSDPWVLLEEYAEASARDHPRPDAVTSLVSWCSWYPYRLSVTEERVVANAAAAVVRLQPLGLAVLQVDLGWQRECLPSAFEENDHFPRGLAWLAGELRTLGYDLGIWSAPYTVSEFDPFVREHPEWLIQDEAGQPFAYWEWYWVPHGKVFILDLTHPGARQWLRERMRSLAERGVRYLKTDFISCVSDSRARIRHDSSIVAGGGYEAARLGSQVVREAMPGATVLSCGGPELPGLGSWDVHYTCHDTGNTGFIGLPAQQAIIQSVGCHLFKRRWGALQPSCLSVGLPGTVEDARIRATLVFLTGGQVDISDDLTTLAEDRWRILTATLPAGQVRGRAIDLFDAIAGDPPFGYNATNQGHAPPAGAPADHPPGSVWVAPVQAGWDEWLLVGVFGLEANDPSAEPRVTRFTLPLARLGLAAGEPYSALEFWSGQFLGALPGGRSNAASYHHPGDMQELLVTAGDGGLRLAFFGPAAKLLCLRRARPHPWVVGTSFHQSCGLELSEVAWQAPAMTLRGVIARPVGESGVLVVDPAGRTSTGVRVNGRDIPFRRGAHGSLVVTILMEQPRLEWAIAFSAG